MIERGRELIEANPQYSLPATSRAARAGAQEDALAHLRQAVGEVGPAARVREGRLGLRRHPGGAGVQGDDRGLAEPLLDPPPNHGDARGAEALSEDDRPERVRLGDDPLALDLERAAGDEERGPDAGAPTPRSPRVSSGSVRGLRDARDAMDVVGNPAASRGRVSALSPPKRALLGPELISRCRQALELGLGVGEQLASSLRLAPGAIDLLRPGAPRRLEPGESRLGRLELGARARGRPLGFRRRASSSASSSGIRSRPASISRARARTAPARSSSSRTVSSSRASASSRSAAGVRARGARLPRRRPRRHCRKATWGTGA